MWLYLLDVGVVMVVINDLASYKVESLAHSLLSSLIFRQVSLRGQLRELGWPCEHGYCPVSWDHDYGILVITRMAYL